LVFKKNCSAVTLIYFEVGLSVSKSKTLFLYSQAGGPLEIPPLGVVKVLGIGGSLSKATYNGAAISIPTMCYY